MTDEELIALADRLTVPTDADHIYEWVVEARKKHRSDFPRMGFAIEMELIDDDRLAAAAAIRALVAERGK